MDVSAYCDTLEKQLSGWKPTLNNLTPMLFRFVYAKS